MSCTTKEIAPAKLNLFLHVLGKFPNGFHSLESLAVFLDLSDEITLVPDAAFGLSISGSMASKLASSDTNDNLVIQAAHKLSEIAGKPLDFALHLEKHIPVQAGLGGGSADAAACLRLLCRYWGLEWRNKEVMDLALSLGADVPVCMHSTPHLMRGIGEDLEPVAVPSLNLLVSNPNKGVSTQTIFQSLNLEVGKMVKSPTADSLLKADINRLLAATTNDLQPTAEAIEPAVSRSISMLKGCADVGTVRMTGSGATCFAVFETNEQAAISEQSLSNAHPDFWFWSGKTL